MVHAKSIYYSKEYGDDLYQSYRIFIDDAYFTKLSYLNKMVILLIIETELAYVLSLPVDMTCRHEHLTEQF